MNRNPEEELYTLADYFANRPDHIQGAGGNISVKMENRMWIKASGMTFREIRIMKGYVQLAYQQVADYFMQTENPRETGETESLNQIALSLLPGETNKPSMETGFHAILGRVVVHTHSAMANVMNCAGNCREWILKIGKKLGFEPLFIPYTSPGYALSREIAVAVKRGMVPPVIFLQNHGIIVHTEEVEEAIALINRTDDAIRSLLNLEDYTQFNTESDNHIYTNYLFPDQVVYFNPERNSEKINGTKSMEEVSRLYDYITSQLRKNGLTPNFLPEVEISYIASMEMEKHRKKAQGIE